MAEEEPKNVESETTSELQPAPEPIEASTDVAKEKSVIPPPPPSLLEEKANDSDAPATVPGVPDSGERKSAVGSIDRDAVLERVQREKRLSLIKAWEESEKSKAENKADKKLSGIRAWENSKRADVEAELKKIEEQLEKKKAKYVEKKKNKVALIHRAAEEKRATIQAKRGEDLLKAEEMAAKYRSTGTAPKKLLGIL